MKTKTRKRRKAAHPKNDAPAEFTRALQAVERAFVGGKGANITAAVRAALSTPLGDEVARYSLGKASAWIDGAGSAAATAKEKSDIAKMVARPSSSKAVGMVANPLRALARKLTRDERKALAGLVGCFLRRMAPMGVRARTRSLRDVRRWLTALGTILSPASEVNAISHASIASISADLLLACEDRREKDYRYLVTFLDVYGDDTPTYLRAAMDSVCGYFSWREEAMPLFPWTKDEYDLDHVRGREAINAVARAVAADEAVRLSSVPLVDIVGHPAPGPTGKSN